MKIALCDDEEKILKHSMELVNAYAAQRPEHAITVFGFSHPEDLLQATEKNGGFDMYILDVVMPGMTGIRLGELLREANDDGKIIYLTSSEEYALDSFRVKAFQYLIKPLRQEALFEVLDDAITAITAKRDKSILVKTKDRSIKLTFHSIVYAELSKRAIRFHLLGGKTVETLSLRTNFSDAIRELLSDSRFALCGAGMAVNMHHIAEIENEAVVFTSGEKIFSGKKACRELRGVWSDFLFSEEA